jgi:F-box-like
MDSLPEELLYQIAAQLPQSPLPALLQTCQLWKSISLPILYRHPVLREDKRCLTFVKTIEQEPEYAKHIRHITIDNWHIRGHETVIYPFHLAAYLGKILLLVDSLFTLSVNGPEENSDRCFHCKDRKCIDWDIDGCEDLISKSIINTCDEATGPLKDLMLRKF